MLQPQMCPLMWTMSSTTYDSVETSHLQTRPHRSALFVMRTSVLRRQLRTSNRMTPTTMTAALNTMHSLHTASERAKSVTSGTKIALNLTLSVFTVVGTKEPHVVRLFRCTAQMNCYHVIVACTAIGMSDMSKKRIANLTQLRKNVRKRPDKTSGCNRLQVNYTAVVTAGDGDDAATSAVAVAVACLYIISLFAPSAEH